MSKQDNNVDQIEIEKFSALAHRWWDVNGEFRPLHEINPLRTNYINQRSPLVGKKAIDVGCGGGILSEVMCHLGAHVTGIDMGEAPLEVARLHMLESGINADYQLATAEQMAEQHPESFDVCTCLEMLEHVPDPQSVINACAKLTKPGGDLYFSTINRNPKSYLFAILGAEYLLNLLPKGTHDHDKFIKPSELAKYLRHSNLSLEDCTGMTYNPVTKVYKLDANNIAVNYIVHARKPLD